MRQDTLTKAKRYLGEARLTVEHVDKTRVLASCRGDGAVYTVEWSPAGWLCSCPARSRCAHIRALQLVTVR